MRGLSILRSEIFRRLSATSQPQWLFFFLPYYRFYPNSPSPLKPTDAREKSTLTPYHMENVALHGLKTNACPKCEVQTNELGTNARSYRARDCARYQRYKPENQTSGSETNDHHIMNPGIGQNIFHRLNRVSASDLYKSDILHTIYLGLFKHMTDWIEDFLKKHGRLQAFDEVWKALPPYPGFLVSKKAYREVTLWQGKEMRNLGRYILEVLAVALRQPGGAQAIPFKRALRCVRALVNFNMMAHYRSHTPDTIAYMEEYLNQFHRMKDIFLEF